jgi:energy-coupling factor transporter transmembrane protein EcfT
LRIISFIKDSVFSDEYAAKNGLLQLFDSRLRFLFILFLIICTLFIKNASGLFILYIFCIFLAVFSKISPVFILQRTLFFMPLFCIFIAAPAFLKGDRTIAILLLLRVTVSVSLVALLSLTTRHSELLAVLRFLRFPLIFVMVLGMAYRYIYLFAQLIENTFLAIKSRTGRHLVRCKDGRKITGWTIAVLWLRSIRLSEEVYSAMLSRGFNGEPKAWKK